MVYRMEMVANIVIVIQMELLVIQLRVHRTREDAIVYHPEVDELVMNVTNFIGAIQMSNAKVFLSFFLC
jgi:hypothetical protein